MGLLFDNFNDAVPAVFDPPGLGVVMNAQALAHRRGDIDDELGPVRRVER